MNAFGTDPVVPSSPDEKKKIEIVDSYTGLPIEQVQQVVDALRASGWEIVRAHSSHEGAGVCLSAQEIGDVLKPLVKDLRDLAITGKRFHYAQITGTDAIVQDMVDRLIERSQG